MKRRIRHHFHTIYLQGEEYQVPEAPVELAPLVTDRVLIVVDVQPFFVDEAELLIAVESAVLKAIEQKAGIVVVEYSQFGDTDEIVMKHLVGKYDRFAVVQKSQNDGSVHVMDMCARRGFGLSEVTVCGVFADQCVADTVIGLSIKLGELTRITVLKEAVLASYHDMKDEHWPGELNAFANVSVR